ncbi:MAG: hypothetical protein IPH07_19575 [Deltaproteobacteria bacterium]|nr:hypothetical protein [Deltaproteobacteria bacterium]MBK8715904.1 hypothetical protein [Deltaproteobacteria bacterium]MBP7286636.1 hypothetical protein [Nannocystaceae bacterium]
MVVPLLSALVVDVSALVELELADASLALVSVVNVVEAVSEVDSAPPVEVSVEVPPPPPHPSAVTIATHTAVVPAHRPVVCMARA